MAETPPTAPTTTAPRREPFHVLLGWLPLHEVDAMFTGRDLDRVATEEERARWLRAREAVAARPAGIDQDGVVQPLPAEVEPHLEALRAHALTAHLLETGGAPRLVDLTRLRAAQIAVRRGEAAERVRGVAADDWPALARLTLPLADDRPMPAAYDPQRNAWMISSPNPNLGITGNFNQPVGPGCVGFGFAAALRPSFFQVGVVGGRHYLQDGYHRALGLLAAGITHVPALVRECESVLTAPGASPLLPAATILGPRPPRLGDYFDPAVAAELPLPVSRKLLVIQALELQAPF